MLTFFYFTCLKTLCLGCPIFRAAVPVQGVSSVPVICSFLYCYCKLYEEREIKKNIWFFLAWAFLAAQFEIFLFLLSPMKLYVWTFL